MGNRQDDLLGKEDWRHFAIDKGGTGLLSIATQEKLLSKAVVGFSLPSAPGLFLNMGWVAHRKRIAIDVDRLFDLHPESGSIYPDDHEKLFDYLEVAMQEIVNSYSAIEAFANEAIPRDYVYRKPGKGEKPAIIFSKDDIERKIALDEKLKRVLPQALNKKSPAGGALWGQYSVLQDLRDRLIHLKSVDRQASGSEDPTIWGKLLRLGSAKFPEIASGMIGHFCDPARRWFKLKPNA